MDKKHIRIASLMILMGLLLFGCSSLPGRSGANSSILDRVMEDGKMVAGVRFDNPPLSYITEDGEWVGFDVDLTQALGEQLGVEVEMVRVDETTRISFLQEGKIDLAIASMNHTRARDEAVDFSITYFWDNQSFLIRKGTFQSLDDLIGESVAANAGSSAIPSWRVYVAEQGGAEPEIVEFTDKLAAMQALRDGAVAGYTEDNVTLLALASGDPDLELLPGGHNPVQYGIGVPVNDSAWRDQINYALQELWKNGTYMEIYTRWFLGPEAEIILPLGGEMEIWPE